MNHQPFDKILVQGPEGRWTIHLANTLYQLWEGEREPEPHPEVTRISLNEWYYRLNARLWDTDESIQWGRFSLYFRRGPVIFRISSGQDNSGWWLAYLRHQFDGSEGANVVSRFNRSRTLGAFMTKLDAIKFGEHFAWRIYGAQKITQSPLSPGVDAKTMYRLAHQARRILVGPSLPFEYTQPVRDQVIIPIEASLPRLREVWSHRPMPDSYIWHNAIREDRFKREMQDE